MMKKYTTPELSISVFDVEDIITASGTFGTLADAITSHGEITVFDADGKTVENVENTAAVYFSWE